MTLPPDRIGDHGQRYVVRALGYPLPGDYWQDIGYTDSQPDALELLRTVTLIPSVREIRVVDRGA